MRVLLINRNDFVDGGADRVFLNTVELLKEYQFQGYRVSALQGLRRSSLSPASEASAGDGKGGEVDTFTRADSGIGDSINPRSLSWLGKLRLIIPYLYNRKVAKALQQKINDFHPDVAHVHLIFGSLSASVLKVLNRNNIPVVMTVHDYRLICPANAMLDRNGRICERCMSGHYFNCMVYRCSENNFFFSAVILLEAWMRKYLFIPQKLVDHFIFVSQFARDKHIESKPEYALKSSIIYNMNIAMPEALMIKGDYFLYFGRLSHEKGILTLITASQMAGVELIIAGSGPQETELQSTICNLQPGTSNIELRGHQSGEALRNLIFGCSFVVVPSEWYENNPMSIVEAFSMGKPVIGSRIGGIPELITPETGFLFEPGNPESLANELGLAASLTRSEYEKMSASCREFAQKNFNREQHLKDLIGVYEKVVNGA